MALVDTHFHLDLHKNDFEIAERIESNGIYSITMTNTPSVFENSEKLSINKKFLRCALGLHPEIAISRKHELLLFKQFLYRTRYIGEIGLDYSITKDEEEKRNQFEIFKQIIDWCSIEKNKILSVHSRKAEKDVIDIIGNSFTGKVILHYYSGPLKEVERAIDFGYYFSINYSMTQTKNGKRIISIIPIDKLLTETDTPFVLYGKNSSDQIKKTINNMAQIINYNSMKLEEQIFANFKRILTINNKYINNC